MKQLTPNEAEQLKQLLASIGWEAKPKRKPRQPTEVLTVKQILAKSKWYRPPTLASLGKPYQRHPNGSLKWFRFVERQYRFNRETGTYEVVR